MINGHSARGNQTGRQLSVDRVVAELLRRRFRRNNRFDESASTVKESGRLKVVLGFADSSLGGTSRSALLYARLWRRAGADVLVYSPRDLHERRAMDAAADGLRITTSLTEVERYGANLVHLHHAAPSAATIAWVRAFIDSMPTDAVVLTHNVFGQPLPIDLGTRTVVGVLGDWVGAQYRLQTGARAEHLRVLPNPQDFVFFRPPSADERRDARSALSIEPDERVILRVGSPSEEKWSKAGYSSLVRAMSVQEGTIRLIGAPPSYEFKSPNVTVVHQPLDDLALRREYWAADVFAHWAARGESFGNVILEALGAGVPVVYRAIQTRDNTPAEFRNLPCFEYVTRDSTWTERLREARKVLELDRETLLRRYGSSAMESKLRQVVAAGNGNADALLNAVLRTFSPPAPLSVREYLAVLIRHNPLAGALKRLRLRRSAR